MNLTDMLNDGVRYAPHYRPSGNSDHLPMTLCALNGLGASEVQIEAFRSEYVTRLHLNPTVPSATDWQAGLGESEQYPALLGYFNEALVSSKPDVVVTAVLDRCISGLPLDAFHPILRLGYARDFNHAAELAAGLAYMTSVHRDLPLADDPVDLLKLLHEQAEAGPINIASNRFGASMMELVEQGEYPTGKAADFLSLADAAMKLYQSTRNFFALHLVTATQALRCSTPPRLTDRAIAAMTGALLASHKVLGSPPLSSKPLAMPASLDPEHAYKYVWACLSEYRTYGSNVYVEEINGFRAAGLVPGWVDAP